MLNIFLKTQLTKKAYTCIKTLKVVPFQVYFIHDSLNSGEPQWDVNVLHKNKKKYSTGFPSKYNWLLKL